MAFGQTRPATVDMSCAQARNLVATRHDIVLGTGGLTYDRFVANRSYCEFATELDGLGVAPTLDNPYCYIGYRCTEDEFRREDHDN